MFAELSVESETSDSVNLCLRDQPEDIIIKYQYCWLNRLTMVESVCCIFGFDGQWTEKRAKVNSGRISNHHRLCRNSYENGRNFSNPNLTSRTVSQFSGSLKAQILIANFSYLVSYPLSNHDTETFTLDMAENLTESMLSQASRKTKKTIGNTNKNKLLNIQAKRLKDRINNRPRPTQLTWQWKYQFS